MTDAPLSRPRDPATYTAVAAIVLPVIAVALNIFFDRYVDEWPARVALILSAVLIVITCWLAVTRDDAAKRAAMVLLAIAAPAAVLMFLRLSRLACVDDINALGLPWLDAFKIVGQVFAVAVVLASTFAIVYGYTKKPLRPASVVLTIYSVIAVIPAGIALFVTSFGDPIPGCVPV